MTTLDFDAAYARLRDALAARPDVTDAVMVGIHTGGYWLAQRLHADLKIAAPLAALNIAHYRDDFDRIGLHPVVTPTKMPVPIEGRNVIAVDDVLYTGRTIRAAMNELFDYGRPAAIVLAVLVDRGGRELPIAADACGLRLDVSAGQSVQLERGNDGALILTVEHKRAV
jgi:pyrimidine operon attenuation protein / uracil phosphoribosyltransferase